MTFLAALAVLTLAALASPAAAQQVSPEDKKLLAEHRLSLPVFERCVAAWGAINAQAKTDAKLKAEMDGLDGRDRGKGISETLKTAESEAPLLTAAMKQQSCPARDFMLSMSSAMYAGLAADYKDNAQMAKELDFVPKENVAAYEKDKPKYKELFAKIQEQSGSGRGSRRSKEGG